MTLAIILLVLTVYGFVALTTYMSFEMHEEVFFELIDNKLKKSLLWFLNIK